MSQLKLTADSGGGTVAIKGPASTTGNAAIEMTVPGTGNSTLLPSATNTGKILQVVSTTKTDHFTTTSSSITEITGLNVSITPSASTSKILLYLNINFGAATDSYFGFYLKRDSTLIATTTAVDGNDTRKQQAFSGYIESEFRTESGGINFLDSPNTTSALSYKAFCSSNYNSRALHINRTSSVTDNTYNGGMISTLTAMEVAA